MQQEKAVRIVELMNEIEHLEDYIDAWIKADIDLNKKEHVHINIDIISEEDDRIVSLIKSMIDKSTSFTFCTKGVFAKVLVDYLIADMKEELNKLKEELEAI